MSRTTTPRNGHHCSLTVAARNRTSVFAALYRAATVREQWVACLALLLCFAVATSYGQKKSWVDYGGGPDNSHFVESKQITKANIGQLEVAWSYPYAQTTFNPLI